LAGASPPARTIGVHRRIGHESPGDVPGISVVRGTVINCTCKIASGLMSAGNSTGSPSACARQINEQMLRSIESKSLRASASRCCRCSCVRLFASSLSASISRSSAAISASRCSHRDHPCDINRFMKGE